MSATGQLLTTMLAYLASHSAHVSTSELADRAVADAVTTRGKELSAEANVGEARALLTSSSTQLIPVLHGNSYIGVVRRDSIPDDAPDTQSVAGFARADAPTAVASTPLVDALAHLDAFGGRRLVVLADDGVTYVGLLCLRSDGVHLCVDAECHAAEPSREPTLDG